MNNTPRQLVSSTARAATVVVVVACVAAAWLSAGKASQQAVATTMTALNATHVTLPAVTVVAQRSGGKAAL